MVHAGSTKTDAYERLFADLHKPLSARAAVVEAERCLFCHDAPCMNVCPTHIDIPLFIRQIANHNPKGAAETILDENILGAMCARVCPTEVLCEEACVRHHPGDEPIKIGLLQRHAVDELMQAGEQPFTRAARTGKRVAVVGAGPAGLACAHRLALHGHDVTLLDGRPKPGGLNEYGIAAYKVPNGIAQAEVDFILAIGGIDLRCGVMLGRDVTLAQLRSSYDAVFLGLGMNAVKGLGLAAPQNVEDAVEFIERLRQANDPADVPVGRHVVVIGGGMTAVDAAIQAKKLGAETVTLVYRRGAAEMNASVYEQALAQTHGVLIRHWLQPAGFEDAQGAVSTARFERTAVGPDGFAGTGEIVSFPADHVLVAIGQSLDAGLLNLGEAAISLKSGRFVVDAQRRTSLGGVWAGGDCAAGGDDLTVAAVEDGKQAAESIHRSLA